MSQIKPLSWNDQSIPHKFWVEQQDDGCKICLEVIKDVEPERLSLVVPDVDIETVLTAWQGHATNITPAFDDGILFTQTRALLNLPQGCLLWAVTHIKRIDDLKMSADKLFFVPLRTMGQ
ncbi:hypothetical protein LRP50_20405 [Enterovibrio sp. ZSDZ42]|uniref:Uncharacterized protein n=1 Tax=Enterovibrio gelatinilyticus TaxID=2899819 RepID=A0ABT5R5E3_9GAMM|nr:hypothetical protein [Enterovibrio sp. ZSDZ42]MDD1795497.1 hypothetical protein [Enterovibrio sp. ZSDZ42]